MQLALTKHRWNIVGAIAVLAALAVAAGSLWQIEHRSTNIAVALTGGNIARAPELIRRYGCAGCHTISGIPGGDGQVGGALSGILRRVFVGGGINTAPEKL